MLTSKLTNSFGHFHDTGDEVQGPSSGLQLWQGYGAALQIQQLPFQTSGQKNPFDNLLVIPDANRTGDIYFCQGTDRASFETNALGCEMQLAQEIFNGHTDGAPKIKCAICLLRGHQQNGFVALTSKLDTSLKIRGWAGANHSNGK